MVGSYVLAILRGLAQGVKLAFHAYSITSGYFAE